MNYSVKKIIAVVLAVALIAALGVTAFADGVKKPGKDVAPNSDNDICNDDHPQNDEEVLFDYDDLDEAFSFDMSEIFSMIKDEEEREKVEQLYDEYMKAYDEEQAAYTKLIDAEDAFFEALNSAEFDDEDMEDDLLPAEEDIDKALEQLENMSLEDLLEIFTQFISWYNSTVKPSLETDMVS